MGLEIGDGDEVGLAGISLAGFVGQGEEARGIEDEGLDQGV